MQPYFCVRQIIGNQSRMDRMCEACAKDPHCADSYIYDYTVILYWANKYYEKNIYAVSSRSWITWPPDSELVFLRICTVKCVREEKVKYFRVDADLSVVFSQIYKDE